MTSADTLHVACAATLDHVAHSAAMLHSVHEHRGALGLHVHFVHGPDIDARTQGRLERWLERNHAGVTFHLVGDDVIAGLPRLDRIPAMMWYRTLLPDLLADVDRVLYIDVDALALDDLTPLWQTDLGGLPFGAVTNVLVEPEHRAHIATLGVPRERYLNSGVLLMDLSRLRDIDATARLLEFGRTTPHELQFPEQDALSVVLGDQRLELHPRWNAMNSVLEFPEAGEVFAAADLELARARPGIRHFEGPSINKPWNYRCVRGMRGRYRHHRVHTPWPVYIPDDLTVRAFLHRQRQRAGHLRRIAR